MADRVTDVVGERAHGEGELVGVLRIAEEIDDEIAASAHSESSQRKTVAEWIVADVLDDASAVGVSAGFVELGGVRFG